MLEITSTQTICTCLSVLGVLANYIARRRRLEDESTEDSDSINDEVATEEDVAPSDHRCSGQVFQSESQDTTLEQNSCEQISSSSSESESDNANGLLNDDGALNIPARGSPDFRRLMWVTSGIAAGMFLLARGSSPAAKATGRTTGVDESSWLEMALALLSAFLRRAPN